MPVESKPNRSTLDRFPWDKQGLVGSSFWLACEGVSCNTAVRESFTSLRLSASHGSFNMSLLGLVRALPSVFGNGLAPQWLYSNPSRRECSMVADWWTTGSIRWMLLLNGQKPNQLEASDLRLLIRHPNRSLGFPKPSSCKKMRPGSEFQML